MEGISVGTPLSVALADLKTGAGNGVVRGGKILLVDDEGANITLLEDMLTRWGFENFASTVDPRKALDLFEQFQPDVVLTDWLMPRLDGASLIAQLRLRIAKDDCVPIIVLTGDLSLETKRRALAAGANDFITKPFDALEVLLRLSNLLAWRLSHLTIQHQNALLEEKVRQRTSELETALSIIKATQQQVIQRERLAALGTMAGGIAHDFNNALFLIMGFGEILLREAENGLTKEQALPALATILGAAQDAAKIVNRLRDFYRPDEPAEVRMPVNLDRLVEHVVLLTKPKWDTQSKCAGCEIRMTRQLGDVPNVIGDDAELREVLTNLIFNAIDAMPNGGAICLTTSADENSVLLTVSDTGIGMSSEVRQRCFEPFFTTKGINGTGFGLAMVFGIIERHGGSIDVKSEIGEGTTFTLRLPREKSKGAAPAILDDPKRSLNVLVIDDQPILCESLCTYLVNDGHTVQTALDAHEAVETFRLGKFDVVIMDQAMPGMTGDRLAKLLKAHNPRVPIILLTGFASPAEKPEGVDLVIGRPIERATVRRALAQVATPPRRR